MIEMSQPQKLFSANTLKNKLCSGSLFALLQYLKGLTSIAMLSRTLPDLLQSQER